MIGAIIGDVIGSRIGFANIKKKDFELQTEGCKYTYNSVLTIAVMDALCHTPNWKSNTLAHYFKKWTKKYPDAGYNNILLKRVYSINPKEHQDCVNGSATRISSVGWFAENAEQVVELSRAFTEVTYNHSEAIKGAEVISMCIFMALHDYSKEDIKIYATEKYPEICELDYKYLKSTYSNSNEICQNAVSHAIYCFLISNSFEDCLRKSICIGGNFNTIAAISCAIADAFFGVPKELEEKVLKLLPKDMADIILDMQFIVNIK